MKAYRCVFTFSNGHTTMSVVAASAEHALTEAKLTVKDQSASIEVWDETGLVLQRKNGLSPHDDVNH